MKKSFFIFVLFLSASFFPYFSAQAQQQRKPSERAFTAEIEKVRQIQAARTVKLSQMPQPVENTPVASNNDKQATVVEQNQTTNTNTSTQQPTPATKPSSGSMRLPKKPAILKG